MICDEHDETVVDPCESENHDEPISEDADTAKLLERIEQLERECEENRDKYMRSVAEFSNYRKRVERDRNQQAWRQKADIVSRFLEITDDFERATATIPESVQKDPWVEGTLLVERKLQTALQELKVVHFESVGKAFDPNLHSALMEYESVDFPAGVVMAELKKGYMMEDQVLRHAMVQVSSGAPADKNE